MPQDIRARGTVESNGGLVGWLREAPPAARRSLLAASLGWMLDAFDIMLYSLVLASLIGGFGMSKATAGFLGALTLIASGFGGVLFGLVADRYGRRRALVGSILVYSIFTAACGLSQTIVQLAVFRFLLGLGMGGEWTAGAALVSETWPDRHRGKALGLMQSAWALGYAAAALAVFLVLPRFGWRAVFFVGIIPAVLTLWIQNRIEEPEVWVHSRATTKRQVSLADIFRAPYGRLTSLLTLLSLFMLFAYWGLNLWVPAYLTLPVDQGGIGLGLSATTTIVVTMQIGLWLGYVSFGFFSDAFGRKKCFVVYLLIASVLVVLFSQTRNPAVLLALSPLVAFFGSGYLAGFGVVTAEIYPTSIRATAQGFTFNMGRLGSAFAPYVVGSLAQTSGFGTAFLLISIAMLLAAVTWIWLPETRGRSLDVVSSLEPKGVMA